MCIRDRVKIVPYKGTTVTRLNRDIVDELIYERIAVEARVLRDFAPHCTPEHRALIRQRAAADDELAKMCIRDRSCMVQLPVRG